MFFPSSLSKSVDQKEVIGLTYTQRERITQRHGNQELGLIEVKLQTLHTNDFIHHPH